jgi:hypothetical protein
MPTSKTARFAIAIVTCAFFITYAAQAQQQPRPAQSQQAPAVGVDTTALVDPSRGYVPGEILVKFKTTPPASALAAVRGQRLKRFARSNVEHWRLGQGVDFILRESQTRHGEKQTHRGCRSRARPTA